jgi:hypothetical protein
VFAGNLRCRSLPSPHSFLGTPAALPARESWLSRTVDLAPLAVALRTKGAGPSGLPTLLALPVGRSAAAPFTARTALLSSGRTGRTTFDKLTSNRSIESSRRTGDPFSAPTRAAGASLNTRSTLAAQWPLEDSRPGVQRPTRESTRRNLLHIGLVSRLHPTTAPFNGTSEPS